MLQSLIGKLVDPVSNILEVGLKTKSKAQAAQMQRWLKTYRGIDATS